jgi:hypothetical protein
MCTKILFFNKWFRGTAKSRKLLINILRYRGVNMEIILRN